MKPFNNILIQLIGQLLKKRLPFAVYQVPGSDKICIVAQSDEIDSVKDVMQVVNRSGFLIFPFDSAKTNEGFFINGELFACDEKGYNELLLKIKWLPPNKKRPDIEPAMETTKQDYLRAAAYSVQKLKAGELDKVVLSRVKGKDLEEGFSIADYYLRLIKKYPDAFVYLFSAPGIGTWVGATPETLLSRNPADELVIMALAGTVKIEKDKPVNWGQKEIEEQQFVSKYIRLRLTELGIKDFVEEPAQTVTAGNMAHIRTIFRISAKGVAGEIGELIKDLHPTPAVCGLPKAGAFWFIEQVERHNRRFYTGYLGPWKLNGVSSLFVNLRCAEITGSRLSLYVGGGLTAASDPEKEWQETELKAGTLLSVLKEQE